VGYNRSQGENRDQDGGSSKEGITDEFMKDLMFKTFDLNSDGKIDAKEFILGMSILTRGTAEEKLEFAFKMYDLNSDGFISREEMTQIVQSLHRMLGTIIIAGTDGFPSKNIRKVAYKR